MKTYKTHFNAFLAFADLQPGTRTIDHRDRQWCGCAIGDYHREATSEPPKGQEYLVNLSENESPLLDELEEEHGLIFNALNNSAIPINVNPDGKYEIDTYFGLATFMRAFEGEPYEDEDELEY